MIGGVPLTVAGSTQYGPAQQLVGARYLELTVSIGAIVVQLGAGIGGQLWTPAEGSMRVPGVWVIPGPCDAIRVRSLIAHVGSTDDPWPTYAVSAYG